MMPGSKEQSRFPITIKARTDLSHGRCQIKIAEDIKNLETVRIDKTDYVVVKAMTRRRYIIKQKEA